MMRGLILAALAWLCIAAAPAALIADVSQRQIDINTTFKGADLLVFGAIQYPAGAAPEAAPDVVIVVRGPTAAQTVRRRDRVAGIWMNTDAVRFESVPGFYAVASTRPIADMADARMTAIYEIGVDNLQLSPASGASDAKTRAFEQGLIVRKRALGLFAEAPGGVTMTRGTLYSARIAIPSAVPVGDYAAEIHLIRRGRVIASATAPIRIGKSGFERWVYVMAQENSLAYGLAAVFAALLAGSLAAVLSRRD